MAIRVPIISDFDEKGVKRAIQAFDKLRADIGKAEGAFGKFKVASGAAFDYAKQNALAFATAATAAVATFVAKSVSNYAKLAIEIGKFSDATRVSMEDSSRLIEVVNDLGIETGSLETALVKMSKAAASGSEAFKTIGAEIYRTSTGAVDVTRTFYNVIDALKGIDDPAMRAKAASDILGKGWMSMAELIEDGSDKLKSSMAEVADTKIFTVADRQRGEAYRAAVDRLKDAMDGFARTVGQFALPAVVEFINQLAKMAEIIGMIPGKERELNAEFTKSVPLLQRIGLEIANYVVGLTGLGDETERVVRVTPEMARVWRDGYQAMIDAEYATRGLNQSLYGQQIALDLISQAWQEYLGYLDVEQTFLNAQTAVDDFSAKWEEAVKNGTANAKVWLDEMIDLQKMIVGIADATDVAKTAAEQNVIQIYVDTWQLERALTLMEMLRQGQVRITDTYVTTPYGSMPLDNYTIPGLPKLAKGGIVTGPTVAMIGEAGPEAVIPLDRLGSMGSITVNVSGSVVSENDLIESIRKGLANSQRNGSQLVYSNL